MQPPSVEAASLLFESEGKPQKALSKLAAALEPMTLGGSGWRKVFAATGRPRSLAAEISPWDVLVLAMAIDVVAESLLARRKSTADSVVVARDSRPTGPAIQGVVQGALEQHGLRVLALGVASLPQVMAWARSESSIQGGLYITASHNPPGYNGLKFVGPDGDVFAAEKVERLAKQLRTNAADPQVVRRALLRYSSSKHLGQASKEKTNADAASWHNNSQQAYADLLDKACFGSRAMATKGFGAGLRRGRFEVFWDFNGSARIRSIDARYLNSYGVLLRPINDTLGSFAHDIVPEGSSFRSLKQAMKPWSPKTLFGVVVDCDGDRGNLVAYSRRKPVALGAQKTFQLVVASELAFDWVLGQGTARNSVVITNDATSLRVLELARAFAVPVLEAEVGEANLLALGRRKEREGFHVLLLGEGSNGGSILPPQSVRDPLAMTASLLKLLFWRAPNEVDRRRPGLVDVLADRLGQSAHVKTLADAAPSEKLTALLRILPQYTTTPVFESTALIPLKASQHLGSIKERCLKTFAKEVDKVKTEWKQQHKFHGYEARESSGADSRPISPGTKKLSAAGGLSIRWVDEKKMPRGFFWMRASQTEPVLRLAVDVKGSKASERALLKWFRGVVSTSVDAGDR